MSLSGPTSATPAFSLSCFDRTDNAHQVRLTGSATLDDEGEPLPSVSDWFKESREGRPVVEWRSLAGGANVAGGIAREVLLGNNANAENFRAFAGTENSNAVLVWNLRDGRDKPNMSQVRDDLLDGVSAVLQCRHALPHPPQEVEGKNRNPEYGRPRAFLFSQLSKEHYDMLTLSTYYCVRLAPDRIVSFGAVPWNMPPCRYLGTLRDVDGILFHDPRVKNLVVEAVRGHVTNREQAIHHFVGSNKAQWWGGNKAIPLTSFLRDRLVPQLVVQPLVQPAQPEIQREAMFRLNIFAPGIFNEDRGQLREGWRQAVLGAADSKINLGFCVATVAQKSWYCSYCLQITHTFRLCPIMHDPSWFDGAREELEEEDRKLAEAYRKTETERAQRADNDLARRIASRGGRGGSNGRGGGRGGSRGKRGGGRGSYNHPNLQYGRA